MFDYSTNWMGPINQAWCIQNGFDWSGGRIDISGDTDSPRGDEIGLPTMKTEDWNSFSDWLDTFESDTQLNLDELLLAYGKPIRWF